MIDFFRLEKNHKKGWLVLDTLINDNSDMYDELMDEALNLNSHKRTKDVIAPQKTREYKKLVKINADDLKASMESGQKLHFLLRLIEKSNKQYIFLMILKIKDLKQ